MRKNKKRVRIRKKRVREKGKKRGLNHSFVHIHSIAFHSIAFQSIPFHWVVHFFDSIIISHAMIFYHVVTKNICEWVIGGISISKKRTRWMKKGEKGKGGKMKKKLVLDRVVVILRSPIPFIGKNEQVSIQFRREWNVREWNVREQEKTSRELKDKRRENVMKKKILPPRKGGKRKRHDKKVREKVPERK